MLGQQGIPQGAGPWCCRAAMACGQQCVVGRQQRACGFDITSTHAGSIAYALGQPYGPRGNADFLLLASVSYRLALIPSGPAEVLQSTAGLTQVNLRSNSCADRYIGEQQRQQRHRFQPKDKIALIESTRVPALNRRLWFHGKLY